MKIGAYCNRNVVVVNKDETALQAAKLMRENHVGDVIIIESGPNGNVPLGLVTDRDLVIELLAEEVSLNDVTVVDVVKQELVSITETAGLDECLLLMKKSGVRRLPVVGEDGYLLGIITVDDIIEVFSEQFTGLVSLFKNQEENERRVAV